MLQKGDLLLKVLKFDIKLLRQGPYVEGGGPAAESLNV
jgi:hypothetical protein